MFRQPFFILIKRRGHIKIDFMDTGEHQRSPDRNRHARKNATSGFYRHGEYPYIIIPP